MILTPRVLTPEASFRHTQSPDLACTTEPGDESTGQNKHALNHAFRKTFSQILHRQLGGYMHAP